MAKLKIYAYPDIVLTQKAQPIARVEKSLWRLADDMLETMYDAPGIGLAANQVGVLEQVLVLDIDYEDESELDDAEDTEDGAAPAPRLIKKNPIVIINPKIVYSEGKASIKEGCLSVPEYRAEVERFDKIKVEYLDLDGKTNSLNAEGLLAIAIQHEMDHLDGRLFIDRLSPIKREMAQKRVMKWRKEHDE
jgi:peptide deformylase